jgi:hypothetical protein
MKAKEIKEDIYDQLIRFDYHRKVNFVYEIYSSVDFKSLDTETRHVINTFPIKVFGSGIDLMSIELDGEQQFHILFIGSKKYLVDTQGYEYPRYIIELKNLGFEIEDIIEDDYIDRMEGLIRIADDQIFNAVVKSLVFELREEDFSQRDILNFLQFKLDVAIEAASK